MSTVPPFFGGDTVELLMFIYSNLVYFFFIIYVQHYSKLFYIKQAKRVLSVYFIEYGCNLRLQPILYLNFVLFLIAIQTQTLTNVFSKVFPFYFYIGIQTQTKLEDNSIKIYL